MRAGSRPRLTALLALVLLPVTLALPTVPPRGGARVHPVAPHLHRLGLAGGPAGTASLPPTATASFSTVGITWRAGPLPVGLRAAVRTRAPGGRWSRWLSLGGPTDDGPGSAGTDSRGASVRPGTAPLYVGLSDGVQASVTSADGRLPQDLRMELVDPGHSDADATLGAAVPAASAYADQAQPTVVTRAQWGADESLRRCFAGYTGPPRVGFVHHTDTGNSYTAADTAAIIRGIYAYHVQSNGWCDIGYNYLVDRYGRVFEGRWGGITKTPLGAHTGGFNDDSFGTALIGTFDSAAPPPVMLSALEQLEAWKLGLAYADPTATTSLVAAPFDGSRYAAGTRVGFAVLSGHRDADSTSCPGDVAYSLLDQIRQATRADMGVGFVQPAASAQSVAAGDPPVHVRAGVLGAQSWQLAVTDAHGSSVATESGTASPSAPVDATWDLSLPGGAAAPPGDYQLTLSGAAAGNQAVPFSTVVTITPPPAGYTPVDPVRVLDTRSGTGAPAARVGAGGVLDLTVVGGTAGVPPDATAVVLNVTAVAPTAGTDIRVYPTPTLAQDPPDASNLNVPKGATVANLVTVKVGDAGRVRLRNAAGAVDLVADLAGFYRSGAVGSAFSPVPPARLLDTRPGPTNVGAPPGPLGPGATLDLAVAGSAGVPADATAVALNVTAVDPTGPTDVRAYPVPEPDTGGYPTVSNLNTTAGVTVPNLVVVKVGSSGRIRLRNQSNQVQLLADLAGYFAPSSTTRFVPLAPVRLLDTRAGNNEIGGPAGALAAGGTLDLQVAGAGGVPAGAAGVVLNVTAVDPSGGSDVRVYPTPGDSSFPDVSNLNVRKGVTVANLVVVPLGQGGRVRFRNAASALYLVADVAGYYL